MQLPDAYKIILDFQRRLHSEYATSANMDEVFNRQLRKTFRKDFLVQQITDKKHYSRIFFMIYYKKYKKLPFINSNALLLEEVHRKSEVIPSRFTIYNEDNEDDESLLSTLLNLVESDALPEIFEDFIAFSIIPSLFLMFLEEDSFNLYCTFIKKFKRRYEKKEIKKNMHYSLARSLFLSPMFLNFIRLTLYPFLKPFYDGQFPQNYQDLIENFQETFQKQILESFEKNVCFIPSYMKIFFDNMKDTFNFLKNCLFEPMFENPEYFLIVDSSITDFEDVMDHIKSILRIIFTDEIIDNISKLIDECKDFEKALFIQQQQDGKYQATYKKVISSFDLDAFKFIEKYFNDLEEEEEEESKESNKKKKQMHFFESLDVFNYQFKLYDCLYDGETEEEGTVIFNRTNNNVDDAWMHFRKLVKDGLPLPPNYPILKKKATIDNFFDMTKTLLVDTCDPSTIIDAIVTFEKFKEYSYQFGNLINGALNSIHTFKSTTESLIFVHKEQEVEMGIMSEYRQELASLKFKKVNSISLLEKLYNTVLTKSLIPENQKETNCFEIISNIQKYDEEFLEYLAKQEIESEKLIGLKCSTIWFDRFFHSINFSNYCSYRSDLHKFDAMAQKVFQEYIKTIKRSTSFQRKPIIAVLQKLDLFEDQFAHLSQIFENNSSPINKIQELSDAFDNIISLFGIQFGADGEDDFTPFRTIVIAYANPPRFVTNLIYLYEFLFYAPKPTINNANFTRIVTSFNIIYNEMKNLIPLSTKLYYYSRVHHRYLDIFISGNNSESIIDLFKSFISLTDNEMLSDKETDKYLKHIKSNPKVPIRYILNFEKFNNLKKQSQYDVTYSIITNFYIGQDIKFNSESNANIKLALFAYIDEKGFSFNKLFSNPVNEFINNDIPNSNKFVVCKPDENADALKLPNDILSDDIREVSNSIVENILKKIK